MPLIFQKEKEKHAVIAIWIIVKETENRTVSITIPLYKDNMQQLHLQCSTAFLAIPSQKVYNRPRKGTGKGRIWRNLAIKEKMS